MSDSTLLVLGYHRIGPPPPGGWETWFFVPTDVFDSHLRLLADGGWELLDADALVAALDGERELPLRAAAITFDDGYSSMVEHALPCLEDRAAPAILFVPSEYVGRDSEFDPWEPRERLCDWDELRLLEQRGVAVESHSATHRPFSDLTPQERVEELARSKAALDEGLDKHVRLFAYPFGDAGEGATALAPHFETLGYRAAFGYPGGRAALTAADRYHVDRVAMGPDTDLPAILANPDAARELSVGSGR